MHVAEAQISSSHAQVICSIALSPIDDYQGIFYIPKLIMMFSLHEAEMPTPTK